MTILNKWRRERY